MPSPKVLAETRSLYNRALQVNPTLPAALMGQSNVLAGILDLDPHADRDRLLREYDQMSLRLSRPLIVRLALGTFGPMHCSGRGASRVRWKQMRRHRSSIQRDSGRWANTRIF